VFDCDGLLLDTEVCWTRGEAALFASYGASFDASAKQALLGTSRETAARVLERLLDQPGRGFALSDELLGIVSEEIARGAAPMPGARELVAAIDGRVPVAVASNSPRFLVHAALTGAGFGDAFDVVLGGDEVSEPKPAPDIYLRACELLGRPPTRSIALEDSPVGVAAARAAGLYVVGVPSLPGLDLDADLVAQSLADRRIADAVLLGQ
jgi:HAD superfamily hydrolase (TIGR01509 family)